MATVAITVAGMTAATINVGACDEATLRAVVLPGRVVRRRIAIAALVAMARPDLAATIVDASDTPDVMRDAASVWYAVGRALADLSCDRDLIGANQDDIDEALAFVDGLLS